MASVERPASAGALLKGEEILVHPKAFTVDGIGISIPPVYRLAKATARRDVGAAVRDVLFTSPSIVPPRFWKERKELERQFLKAAGTRSWRSLEANARSCWIVMQGGSIVLTPLRNGGTRGDAKGFQPFGASDIVLPASSSDEDLGTALIEALDKSE